MSYTHKPSPPLISASRRTDIPAFYADWFFHRLQEGYSAYRHPFNPNQISYVSYEKTRFIVFWSKNPAPLLPRLGQLDIRGIGCYIQYTLNDYEEEGYEPYLSPLQQRIDTFRRLAEQLGEGRVVWRFDPLLLTEELSVDKLLARIGHLGDALRGYTERLVFSFADIAPYRRVAGNLTHAGVRYREWDEDSMYRMAQGIAMLNRSWGYELQSCAEPIDLSAYGIMHAHCIDERLITRFAYQDTALMRYMGVEIHDPHSELLGTQLPTPEHALVLPNGRYALFRKNLAARGQRTACGCMRSTDIGQYHSCPHGCVYCYANSTQAEAQRVYSQHLTASLGESIEG